MTIDKNLRKMIFSKSALFVNVALLLCYLLISVDSFQLGRIAAASYCGSVCPRHGCNRHVMASSNRDAECPEMVITSSNSKINAGRRLDPKTETTQPKEAFITRFLLTSVIASSILSPVSFSFPFSGYSPYSSTPIGLYAAQASEPSSTVDDPATVAALANVQRVASSLRFILQDIDNGLPPKQIFNEIKVLLNNYRLKSTIELAVVGLPGGAVRSQGQALGKEAFEYLTQIYEYFDDGIDINGIASPREILQFAQGGVKAAEQQLTALVQLYPPPIRDTVVRMVNEEFQAESSQ